MKCSVVTLFPDMFTALTDYGINSRAIEKGLFELDTVNLRDFADDARGTVDDRPYGGGPGMVLLPGPLSRAIRHVKAKRKLAKVVYVSPVGRPFTHAMAKKMAQEPEIIFLAGRYEGVDQRIIDNLVDEQVSLGDYVLSGGEFAVMSMLDAMIRLLPGALGDADSVEQDSFVSGVLDYPHYTRPSEFEGHKVPDVLLSGSHAEINKYRRKQALGLTWLVRAELLDNIELSLEDENLLAEFKREQQKN